MYKMTDQLNSVAAKTIGIGATKVLVLHGWFGPSVYDGFFEQFDLNFYQFVIVHNPGYGAAKSSMPAPDMTALAKSILTLADQLGWTQFHIIGHSYGAAAGLRMATLAPNKISSLVGIAPVMPSGFDAIAVANCKADAQTGPTFMAAYAKGQNAFDGPRMIAAALDPILAKDEIAMNKLISNLYCEINEATYQQYFRVWTGCSFVNEVKDLATKTLFLLGKSDPFAALNYVTPTKESMHLGAVEIQEIPGGHFLPLSGRKEAIKAIQSFLDM